MKQINPDGSVVCEVFGDGSTNISSVTVSNFTLLDPSTQTKLDALCPADYTVTGGGFLAYPVDTIIGNGPTNNNGWRAHMYNNTSELSYTFVVAQCIKIVAP